MSFLEKEEKAEEKRIEFAIVMVHDDKHATLVHGVGLAIEGDLDADLGRDEAGPTRLSPSLPGLWVWEGIPLWSASYEGSFGDYSGSEPSYEGGTWRRPTFEELGHLRDGSIEKLFGPSRWPPESPKEET